MKANPMVQKPQVTETASVRGRRWSIRARWVILLLGTPLAVLVALESSEPVHPAPRSMDHAGHIVDPGRFGADRVAGAYRMAAAIPTVLDGLYCYCECREEREHYSLHDCFTGLHAARCGIAREEASIAHRVIVEGGTLGDARRVIDQLYD